MTTIKLKGSKEYLADDPNDLCAYAMLFFHLEQNFYHSMIRN